MSKEIEYLQIQANMKAQGSTLSPFHISNFCKELADIEIVNRELQLKQERLKREVVNVKSAQDDQGRRHKFVTDLEREAEEEKKLREQLIRDKICAEEELDNINAEISTLSLVKRVLENKLEHVADMKIAKLKERQILHLSAEEERNSYVSQIQVRITREFQ